VNAGRRAMKVVVVAMVGLLAMLGVRPSQGGGLEPVRLPDGSTVSAVEFDRHVASLFGRLGCNAGSCHGSFQGRGGLNLSLFGHDPARDFDALTHGAQGRRVNVLEPDRSLVLLKATGRCRTRGPAVRPGVMGVSCHPRVDRGRCAARPGSPRGTGDRDPASGVATGPSGRDWPARGRRTICRRLRSRRHCVL